MIQPTQVLLLAQTSWLSGSSKEALQACYPDWQFADYSWLPVDLSSFTHLLLVAPAIDGEVWSWLHSVMRGYPGIKCFWFSDCPELLQLQRSGGAKDLCLLSPALLADPQQLAARLAQPDPQQWQQGLQQAFSQSSHDLREHLLQMRQELQAGQELQLRLFPHEFLPFPPFLFSHYLTPCHYLSGDFVDYFQLSDSLSMGILADVSGHGVSSALLTVLIKTELSRWRQWFSEGRSECILSLSELMSHLNQELLSLGLSKHATVFVFLLDRQQQCLHYASAAHFPLPVLRVDGELLSLTPTGMALGLMANQHWQQQRVSFERLQLFACSDGLLDALLVDGLAAKEQLLFTTLAKGDWQLASLLAELKSQMSDQVVDDITILLVNETR